MRKSRRVVSLLRFITAQDLLIRMGHQDFSEFSKEILNQRIKKLNLIDLRDSLWISTHQILIKAYRLNVKGHVKERFEIRMGKL